MKMTTTRTTTTTTTTKTSTTMLIALAVAGLAAVGAHARQGCTTDLNGDGIVNGADLTVLASEWGATFAPVASSVSPASGPLQGGTEVTITGSHLAATTAVTIGGVEVPKIVSRSAESVVVITPPGGGGPTDVVVTTPFGAATIVGGFSYSSPVPWATILEFSPDPAVVTDASLRAAIIATGLPWRVRDNASQIEMLLVPPGTFMMGCSPSDQYGCREDELPVHEVTLTQPFYLGRFEVTQAQWTAVMGSNPSQFQGQVDSPSRPVERVSWNMLQVFETSTGFRLPTEAEWEYACRAGTTTAFNNGSNVDATLGSLAWFNANSGDQTRPVGQKLANALGFHDMHGNVWEWCEDWYGSDYYSQSAGVDPQGPASGTFGLGLTRGGSFNRNPFPCRTSGERGGNPRSTGATDNGFRVARTP